MSEPTDPIDQAERSAAERALKAQMAGVVRNLFGGSDAEVLQAIVQELRELKSTQRRVRELLERWDADGWPSTRVPE